MILEELQTKYQNAKEWFHRNYDNPKESERALRHYKETADALYFFQKGERIKEVNTPLVQRLRERGL
jgi:hypothetical protein